MENYETTKCVRIERRYQVMTCPTPIRVRNPLNAQEYNTVPCGRCYACASNKRQDWQIRIQEETLASKSAIFVTLTYNDSNLEYNENGFPSVWKKTLQDYFKRLRRSGLKFRYYAVGEYGTKSKRPHYHIIFFNLTTSDEEQIQNSWVNTSTGELLGTIDIIKVNLATIGYITKYHVNRNNVDDPVNKEFTLMSRKPAIGIQYVEKHKKTKTTKSAYYQDFQYRKRLPRIYREKLFPTEHQKAWLKKQEEEARNETEKKQAKKEAQKGYFEKQSNVNRTANETYKKKSNLNRKL